MNNQRAFILPKLFIHACAWIVVGLSIALTSSVKGQNLVSNAGFETYSALPTSYGQINYAVGWNNCNGGGTPDYFHTSGSVGTYFGTNLPHTGQAMAGFCPWHGAGSNFREYISSQLNVPMTPGVPYTVSFWLAGGNGGYGYGCNNIGVNFSTSPLTQTSTTPILLSPQVEITNVFFDTLWTHFVFQFTPASAFNYISIGNFRSDAATTAIQFTINYAAVYYYIDDISVQPNTGLPVAVFVSSDSAFCAEGSNCIDFTDHSTGNPTSWKWLFPGAVPDTSTIQNPTNICYFSPGTYNVTLIASNANGTDTLISTGMIKVGATPPAPVILLFGDTLVCSQPPAASYQWYYNGAPVAGASDSIYVATMPGNYSVMITDWLGCTRLSVGVYTSVNELAEERKLKIYPNPVGDEFTVSGLSHSYGIGALIEIYDMLGNKVYSGVLNSNPETISSKHFSPGICIIEVSTDDKVYRAKFVKE